MAKLESQVFNSASTDCPPHFDGTTRLYTSYICPFAQRVMIARNYKGLQDQIKLVAIDIDDKPAWYKEKIYPAAKVPALEHNNEIRGESLDLLKYIDSNFEGPPLFSDEPAKKELTEELWNYIDTFGGAVFRYLKGASEDEIKAALDKLEEALAKFDDGPFFLGHFSAVDIAYAPFIERFQPLILELRNYDITCGRPKLATWIQELDKIDAYKQTKWNLEELTTRFKKRILGL